MRHEFVESVPDELASDVLYVCIPFATVVHKCACGCGNEVVTPLSPTDWRLTFNGVSISLYPSIGNWSFPCRSHYFIEYGNVRWSRSWSDREIAQGRQLGAMEKEEYFTRRAPPEPATSDAPPSPDESEPQVGCYARLIRWLRGGG